MSEQIYILTEQNEVKETSSIYYGDDNNKPQLIKQVYRTDEDGNVVLAKCYHEYDANNITYVWDGYSSCTAEATCKYDSEHTLSETAEGEYKTNPYNSYEYNYFAYFNNPLFIDQQYYDDWQSNYEPEEHEHSWTWAHNSSEHWQKCSCGAIQNEESHDNYLEETDHQHGTCVTPETTSYKCTKCGWTTTVTGEIDPTEHTGNTYEKIENYHFWESEASNKGTKVIYCTDCEKKIGTKSFYSHTPIYPNSWNHTSEGHYQCCQSSECNWETLTPVKDQAHNYVWYPNDEEIKGSHIEICATCNRQRGSGYHSYTYTPYDSNCDLHIATCSLCGHSILEEHTDYTGNGVCVCGASLEGHTYNEGYTYINSTYHSKTCTKCGQNKTEHHDKLSYTYDESAHTVTCATCTGSWIEEHQTPLSVDATHHKFNCKCGYSGKVEHKLEPIGSEQMCTICGWSSSEGTQ